MMLDRLGGTVPSNAATADTPTALADRLRQSLEAQARRPDPGIPEFGTKPMPPAFDTKPFPPDPAYAMDLMVRQWWANEFMMTLFFGDEDKLGTKAEPYA